MKILAALCLTLCLAGCLSAPDRERRHLAAVAARTLCKSGAPAAICPDDLRTGTAGREMLFGALMEHAAQALQADASAPAAAAVDAAFRLYPDRVAVAAYLGEIEIDRGDYRRAVKAFRRANALQPDHAGMLSLLALAEIGAGHKRRAVKAADRAVALAPLQPLFLIRRAAVLSETGDYVRAMTDCARAMELAPDDDGCLYTQADILMKLGRVEDAMVNVNLLMARDETVELFGLRADLRCRLGDQAGARADVSAGLALDPRDASLLARRIDACRR